MNSLHNLQQEFLDYLLDDARLDIVERMVSTPQCSAAQRMRFYGNAYRLRLQETLSTDYERLHAYLGDELFESLMRQYIDRYPSRYASLRDFGAHMVELVSTLEPFCEWPEVEEIARIELAFNYSFDVADAPIYTQQQLMSLEPEAWSRFTLRFNDSVQLVPQSFNSFQIWQALSSEQEPPAKQPDPATWLVWRQNLVTRYRSLDKAELAALETAMAGGSFAEICETLVEYLGEQKTPQQAVGYLQQWIHDQMVSELIV